MPFNQAQIQADHTALKALEVTIAANFATLQGNLRAHADLLADISAAGGNGAAAWHLLQIQNLGKGYTARLTQGNGPGANPVPFFAIPQIAIFANNESVARDFSQFGDQRPVSAYDPSLT